MVGAAVVRPVVRLGPREAAAAEVDEIGELADAVDLAQRLAAGIVEAEGGPSDLQLPELGKLGFPRWREIAKGVCLNRFRPRLVVGVTFKRLESPAADEEDKTSAALETFEFCVDIPELKIA